MHNKFEQDTLKTFRAHKGKLLTVNVKKRKKSAIFIFFQQLVNLSENWS